jgi:hypothetical protein
VAVLTTLVGALAVDWGDDEEVAFDGTSLFVRF